MPENDWAVTDDSFDWELEERCNTCGEICVCLNCAKCGGYCFETCRCPETFIQLENGGHYCKTHDSTLICPCTATTLEEPKNKEHILYRMFDSKYRLLYVGITLNVHNRMKQHGGSKDWWPEVQQIVLERFPSRAELVAAERRVILTEHPKYNKQHNMIGV